jgi:N-acetylmuramoyl-L-alanine amidase
MRTGVDYGHNCPGANTGAVGIRKEDDLIMEVGPLVTKKLEQIGHTVVLLKPESNYIGKTLTQRVEKANESNLDLVISIHFNQCPGGYGTEVFAIGSEGRTYATQVLNEICALGYHNRGVKDGSGLAVVAGPVAPAILIECCFIDSQEDMDRYNAEELAVAIVKGITGQEVRDEEPVDYIGYMMRYRDLMEAYGNIHPEMVAWAKWHYDNYGKQEIAAGERV